VLITSAKAGPAIIEDTDKDWSGALPATFLYDAAGARTQKKTGAITRAAIDAWLEPAGR